MGQELPDPVVGMLVDADQDVGEVDLGIDVVPLTRRHERIEHHESAPGGVVAEEERILSRQCDDSQRGLTGVVVNGHVRIVEECGQALPLVAHVTESIAHRTFRFEERGGLVSPRAKPFEHRSTLLFPKGEMLLGADDSFPLHFTLDEEQLEDDIETTPRLGRTGERIEEVPPRVRLMPSSA